MQPMEMHSERITFLATPSFKARLADLARANGVSIGEYVRRRVQEEEEEEALTEAEEILLAALVDEVNCAIPKMHASFDRMEATLRKTREDMDAFLREKGIRK